MIKFNRYIIIVVLVCHGRAIKFFVANNILCISSLTLMYLPIILNFILNNTLAVVTPQRLDTMLTLY